MNLFSFIMGQKIHPLGFRVGITKSHQSQWFARFHKRKYAQTVLEDRLLRETLLKLFPELLNPVLKKVQKREGNIEISPKITHIKIERGLIPYEIGIQIHAGNCELIKSAIDHLQIDENFTHNVQKTRGYLLDLKTQLKDSRALSQKQVSKKSASFSSLVVNRNKMKSRSNNQKGGTNTVFSYRKTILENIMVLKKGKKITRKLQKKFYSLIAKAPLKQSKENFQGGRFNSAKSRDKSSFSGSFKNQKAQSSRFSKTQLATKRRLSSGLVTSSFGQSPKVRSFVDIFLSKMSQQFLKTLKTQMNDWNRFMKVHKEKQLEKYGQLRFAPLGYQRKWSLTRLKRLQKQPLNLLNKLLKSLQKKALTKLQYLQKQFTGLGTISKTESFNYYQMIRFIKAFKQLIKQLKMEQTGLIQQKLRRPSFDSSPQIQQKLEKSLLALTDTALTKKFHNINDECRKVKFIDYLQNVVKKHRQKNIFLYLSTISDSRKFLRKIQQFTKQQASFLFGIDLKTLRQYPMEKQREQIINKVSKALKEVNRKNQLEKNVQDIFIEQMQKQRTVCLQNIELTPKISLKFYSVKMKNLETNASLVADSIVDDLEKRKAFRGVIKKAKDQLMASSKVKGVKILVSGRLNGAEIARSEWVRAGRVPLQTLRANIDYCYKTANTIYGIIGVKVWIYKGYTKIRQPVKPNSDILKIVAN